MQWIQIIFPSFALCCALFLGAFALLNFHIWRATHFARPRLLFMLSLLGTAPAILQLIVQSRIFANETVYWASLISLIVNAPMRIYYLRTVTFFIAIPDRFLKFCCVALTVIGVLSLVPLLDKIFGGWIPYSVPADMPPMAGNYFFDSFSIHLGEVTTYTKILLCAYSLVDLTYSIYLMRNLLKTTRDVWFLSGLFFICFVAVQYFMLPFTTGYTLPLVFFAYFLECLRMTYFSAKEYLIDTEVNKGNLQKLAPTRELVKYQNSNLSNERIQELGVKLKQLLEISEIYKDPNLRLEALVPKMGIPSYQLSQVISVGLQSRFHELVNTYRIHSVLKEMKSKKWENQNILDIAFANGFNSKSTFNLAFKKVTGKTPTEYKNELATNNQTLQSI